MSQKVVETVSFKLVEGVSDEAFIATAGAVTDYLKTCDGFNKRHLSKGEDGIWLEHLEWASMADATEASKEFMQQEAIMPYMQSIDPESVKMQHNQLHLLID